MGLIYNGQMRFKWNFLRLAMLMALFVTGCSGINTGGSVSPASFFLPGLLKAGPSAVTNAPVAGLAGLRQFALAR